eukprot:scaffold129232_cov44-Prasinocladus_malaysianus.AAC.2
MAPIEVLGLGIGVHGVAASDLGVVVDLPLLDTLVALAAVKHGGLKQQLALAAAGRAGVVDHRRKSLFVGLLALGGSRALSDSLGP